MAHTTLYALEEGDSEDGDDDYDDDESIGIAPYGYLFLRVRVLMRIMVEKPDGTMMKSQLASRKTRPLEISNSLTVVMTRPV